MAQQRYTPIPDPDMVGGVRLQVTGVAAVDGPAVTTTPTWFGRLERPLFGWLHAPESGAARGVAVVCGPVGRESTNALWAIQTACDQLATRGIAAFRFAYAGTGDSAGRLDDPDRLDDWLGSIEEAVSWARELNGGPVVLIGLRMGALLAAEAVARGTRIDALIQWDPSKSGRTFLRTEQMLLAAGYGGLQIGDGSIAGPAFVFSADTVKELSALQLTAGDPAPELRRLVLTRRGERGLAGIRQRFPPSTDWIEVDGQAELLDVPPDMVTLPLTAITAVVDWANDVIDTPAVPLHFTPTSTAAVPTGSDRPASEYPVWLGRHALFGMRTEPAGTDPTQTPTIVFLSAGALDHTGPGRMWVALARDFAREGIRSIRVDLDGIGETFGRPGQPRNNPRRPESIDDLTELATALGDATGGNLIFTGLSSGAYHALEAGLLLHPEAVCAVNPGLMGWVPEIDHGVIDPRRQAYRPMPKVLRSLAVKHARVARWTWRIILQVWVKGSPNDAVAGVCRRGTAVLLVISEGDARQFEPSLYWSAVRRRLRRRKLLDVEFVAGRDHSLYTREAREQAYDIVTRWVVSHYGRSASGEKSDHVG